MSLEENAKRRAEEAAKKRMSEQKLDLLNSRGPTNTIPVGKPLPQPDLKVGPPPRKE